MAVNKNIGQPSSYTDAADVRDGITCNATTSTLILVKEPVAEGTEPRRMKIFISIVGKPTYIKLQSAVMDDDKKGILVLEGPHQEINLDAMYSGEISGITTNANSIVYLTVL